MTKFFPASKNAFSYYGNIYLILAVRCWFREIITRKEDDGDVFLSVLVRDNVYKKLNETRKGTLSCVQTPSPAAITRDGHPFLPSRDAYSHRAHFTWGLSQSWRGLIISCFPSPTLPLNTQKWSCFFFSFFFLVLVNIRDHCWAVGHISQPGVCRTPCSADHHTG